MNGEFSDSPVKRLSVTDFQTEILEHWKLYLEGLSDSDSDSELGTMSKRDNSEFLYRGQEFDTEGVNKPLKLPSTEPDYNMTIADHITNYSKSSPYLSLSKDLNVATLYAMCYSQGKKSKVFVVNKNRFKRRKYFDMRRQMIEFLEKYTKSGRNVPIQAIKFSMNDHEVLTLPDRTESPEIPSDWIAAVYEVEQITEPETAILEKMIQEKKVDPKIFWRKYTYRQDTWSKFLDGVELKSKKKVVKYFKYRPIITVTPPEIELDRRGVYSCLLNDNFENFDQIDLNEEAIYSGAWTILHYAAYLDAENAAKYLVQYGKDIIDFATKEEGWTPLMICSIKNSAKVMKILLDSKADRSIRDLRVQTALSLAQDYESVDCLKLLSN